MPIIYGTWIAHIIQHNIPYSSAQHTDSTCKMSNTTRTQNPPLSTTRNIRHDRACTCWTFKDSESMNAHVQNLHACTGRNLHKKEKYRWDSFTVGPPWTDIDGVVLQWGLLVLTLTE